MQIQCRERWKSGKGIASKAGGLLKTISDHFYYLSFLFVQQDGDMHHEICWVSSESGEKEEVTSCTLGLVEGLLALRSSSSACIVEKLTSL